MGYQALLFCPDEKLSIVVSQLFGELDFSVEVVHEPFAAVKKLMAQRYDAIVVDNENEQNASLLFKSARNSASNHSALAIAIVAGQAGITKAYRIGANLVLTKPINVEQTKGTLRVARGLLRKTSEAAGVAAPSASAGAATNPASPTLESAAASGELERRQSPRLVFSSSRSQTSESGPSLSPEARSAKSRGEFPGAYPETPPIAAVEDKGQIADPDAINNRVEEIPGEGEANTSLAGAGSSPARGTISAFPASTGSATAPASAPEVRAPVRGTNRIVESEPASPSHKHPSGVSSHDSSAGATFSSEAANDSPMFAGVGQDSDGLSANKKMLIAAVIVLALAGLVYLGYGLLVKSKTIGAPQSMNLPQGSEHPAAGAEQPVAGSDPQSSGIAASTTNPTRATAVTPSLPAKAAPTASSGQPLAAPGKSTVISIAANTGAHIAADGSPADQLDIGKPSSKPLRVKLNGTETKTKAKNDEPAPQLPAMVASADENRLSGVMSSEPSSVPRLSVATIKVSQGVSEGLLIRRIQPKYPRDALLAHAQGAVQIEATINKEGFVRNAKVLRGSPVLARAAVEAVSQWRYKPYYLDGAPVEIQTQITVNFRPN